MSACATTKATETKERPDPVADLKIEDYFPLRVGNRWNYRITSLGSSPVERSIEIVKRDGDAFVDNLQARYRVDSYGLRNDNIRYLLKYPLRVGTQWLSVANITSVERYAITQVDQRVRVPAGEFEKCLVVKAREERAGYGANEVVLYFAPKVGLIKNIATREMAGKRAVINTMELLDFRPAS
jgi:hypothetical protein